MRQRTCRELVLLLDGGQHAAVAVLGAFGVAAGHGANGMLRGGSLCRQGLGVGDVQQLAVLGADRVLLERQVHEPGELGQQEGEDEGQGTLALALKAHHGAASESTAGLDPRPAARK